MARKRIPSKATARRAGKILSNPRSSKPAKSSAARTLAKLHTTTRSVKAAPKTGKVGRTAAKRAVWRVTSSRTRKK